MLKIIEVYQIPLIWDTQPAATWRSYFTWRSKNGREKSIFSKIKIHHIHLYTVYNWMIWGIDICKPFLHTTCLYIATVHCNKRSRSWWNWTLTEARALPALFVQPTCSWWKDHGSNTDLQVMGWNQAKGDFDQTISDVKATTATSTSVVQWLKFVPNGHRKHMMSYSQFPVFKHVDTWYCPFSILSLGIEWRIAQDTFWESHNPKSIKKTTVVHVIPRKVSLPKILEGKFKRKTPRESKV